VCPNEIVICGAREHSLMGGDAGGHVVAQGTPKKGAGGEKRHTGQYLRRVLQLHPETPMKTEKQDARRRS
jgi:hypothetical protein